MLRSILAILSLKKNKCSGNHTCEQKGQMNNIDHFIDAQNFKYQNINTKFLSKNSHKFFEAKCHIDLINV